MAIKKKAPAKRKVSSEKQLVQMSGGWEKPKTARKRKTTRKRGLAGKNDVVSKLLSAVIENGKVSGKGYVVDLGGRSAGGALGMNEEMITGVTYAVSVLGSALLPNKMKAVKNILENSAQIQGYKGMRMLENAFFGNLGTVERRAVAQEEVPAVSGNFAPAMAGNFAPAMAGNFTPAMSGDAFVDAMVTAQYLVSEDELESEF